MRVKSVWTNVLHAVLSAVLSFAVHFFALPSFASERLGTLEVEEVLLRPTLVTVEDTGGEFDLADSSFSLRWRKDKNLSAYLAFSSTLARNLPIYYAAVNENTVGFYEAYAEYSGLYGRIRFGLLPINYSYDGQRAQRKQIFDYALLYTERIMGLRDYGFSYYTSHNGYFTEVIMHNGEIDTTSDGRLFTTGHWGWSDSRRWLVQLSLQTGSVQGNVSAGATHTIAGVTNGESATWRHGSLFTHWTHKGWGVIAQVAQGEVEQDNYEGGYNNWLLEATKMVGKNVGFGFRLDELDPNSDLSGDKITKTHLAVVLRSNDATSNLYILGTKVSEESNESTNDELRLVWLVTPFTN